jgi:hypothetical protein
MDILELWQLSVVSTDFAPGFSLPLCDPLCLLPIWASLTDPQIEFKAANKECCYCCIEMTAISVYSNVIHIVNFSYWLMIMK